MKMIKLLLFCAISLAIQYSFGSHIAHQHGPGHESKEEKEEFEKKYDREAINFIRSHVGFEDLKAKNPELYKKVETIQKDIADAITRFDYKKLEEILKFLTDNKRFHIQIDNNVNLEYTDMLMNPHMYTETENVKPEVGYIIALFIDYLLYQEAIESLIELYDFRINHFSESTSPSEQALLNLIRKASSWLRELKKEYEQYKKEQHDILKEHLPIPGLVKEVMEFSGSNFFEYLMEKHHEKGSSSSSSFSRHI